MTGPETSLTLLRQISQGNDVAWFTFDSRYSAFIIGTLKWKLDRLGAKVDLNEVQDGLQMVLLALVRAIHNYNPEHGFRPYLAGICFHVAYELNRQRGRHNREKPIGSGGAMGQGEDEDGRTLVIEDHNEAAPDQQLVDLEDQLVYSAALKLLGERAHRNGQEDAHAAFLADVEGLEVSSAELAKAYGVKEATVRSWRLKQRRALKQCWVEFMKDYFGATWRQEWDARLPGVAPET